MSKQAMYVPGKVGFKQPEHGKTGTSNAKNKGKLGFKQPSHAAGKTSSKKNPGKLGFTQKTGAKTAPSSKKNPSKVGFSQPNPAKKSVSTGVSVGSAKMPKMGKMKGQPKVSDNMKFKSMDDVISYRKKKYGV